MMALPEPSPKDSSLNTEFLNSQRMFRLLWRKWSADWLPHLQARPKWRHETDNLQCNDMIIIKDDRTSPSDWKLERIIDLNPGTDGLVRVATVKTSTGIYKRSVSKICRLSLPRITEESRPSTKPMHLWIYPHSLYNTLQPFQSSAWSKALNTGPSIASGMNGCFCWLEEAGQLFSGDSEKQWTTAVFNSEC